MNVSELSALINEASDGDIDAYLKLYGAVYRPLYKIARTALKTQEEAVCAIHQTALDSFAALPAARITGNAAFIEWIVKILCTKIRHLYKISQGAHQDAKPQTPKEFDMRAALDTLPDIERLVLAVSTVCGCSAEKTAKLCGYTEETVSVCLTNAEVTLKTLLLSKSE